MGSGWVDIYISKYGMRHWITLVENLSAEQYINGTFYHGTARDDIEYINAREKIEFASDRVAYFTQNRAVAEEYAWMDAEMDEGPPHLVTVKLRCHNPVFLPLHTMQDIHLPYRHANLLKTLIDSGYDCIMTEGIDEIAVIDPSKIDIISIENLDEND